MENKNKGLIIFVIILSVLVVGLGGFVVYDKVLKNKPNEIVENENNQNQENEENKNNVIFDILSFGMKSNNKIYALKNDGTEVELMDISKYNSDLIDGNSSVVYTYDSGRLYLYIYTYVPGKVDVETGAVVKEVVERNTLGYINVNDNPTFTKLADVETEGSPSSIAIVNDVLYYTSSSFDGIYQYDINTNKASVSNNFDLKGNINVYTVYGDYLGYQKNGSNNEGPSVGLIDTKTGTKKEISTFAHFEYVHNGKIVYSHYDVPNNYSKWTYYEYNVNDESSKKISDSTSSSRSVDTSFIIPIDDYYIYVNENILNKYSNNKVEKIYEFDGGIDSISLVSKYIVNVIYGCGPESDCKYGTYNLNTKKLTTSQTDNSYSKVIHP